MGDLKYRMVVSTMPPSVYSGPQTLAIYVWGGTGPVRVYERSHDTGKFHLCQLRSAPTDRSGWAESGAGAISTAGGKFHYPEDGRGFWDALPVCNELNTTNVTLRDGAPAEFLAHLGSHSRE